MKSFFIVLILICLGFGSQSYAQTIIEERVTVGPNLSDKRAMLARNWVVLHMDVKDAPSQSESDKLLKDFKANPGKYFFNFDKNGALRFKLIDINAQGEWKLENNNKTIACKIKFPEYDSNQIFEILELMPDKLVLSFKTPSGQGSAILTLSPAPESNN